VALPHAAHAGRRHRQPSLLQLVGDADLAEGRLLDGQRDNGVFDLLRHAVLHNRLLAADLLQRQLAAFVVQLLEAIEAVPAVAHYLARLADIAELLGKLQQPDFGTDDLLFGGHGCSPIRRGGALRNPDHSAPRLGYRFAVGPGHHMSA
jgi:hypothetical protein